MFRGALFVLGCMAVASAAWAMPDYGPPPQHLQSASGRVEMQTAGRVVTLVVLGEQGEIHQRLRVKTATATDLPRLVTAESAQVLTWEGNLIFLAPEEGKAFHFIIPSVDLPVRRNAAARRVPLKVSAEDLDALAARYDFTRIETATEILSWSGPVASRPEPNAGLTRGFLGSEIDYPVYTDPEAPFNPSQGSCGRSCQTTCGDGSQCSVSCAAGKCSHCSCPASCSCSGG